MLPASWSGSEVYCCHVVVKHSSYRLFNTNHICAKCSKWNLSCTCMISVRYVHSYPGVPLAIKSIWPSSQALLSVH